jgi:hypothetical protein
VEPFANFDLAFIVALDRHHSFNALLALFDSSCHILLLLAHFLD